MKDKYVYLNGKADGVPALNDKMFYMNEKPMDCRFADGVPARNIKPMDCRFADGLPARNIKPMDCRFANGLLGRKILFTYLESRWSPGIE